MRKLIAALAALLLALGLGCAAFAEPAEAKEITPANWLAESLTATDWIQKDGRGTLDIEPVLDETSAQPLAVKVYLPDSAEEGTEWTFFCKYDPDTHNLLAEEVTCFTLHFAEGGEVDQAENVYTRESKAVLELEEDGLLTLFNTDDDAVDLLGFEPLPAPQAKGTPLTDTQAALVAEVLRKHLGVSYEPLCVLSEADSMLCVLCRETVIYPGAEPGMVLMFINVSDPEAPSACFWQVSEDSSEG